MNPFKGGFASKVAPAEPVLTVQYFWNTTTRQVGYRFPRPVADVFLTEIQLAQHIACLEECRDNLRKSIELTEKLQPEVTHDPEGRTA